MYMCMYIYIYIHTYTYDNTHCYSLHRPSSRGPKPDDTVRCRYNVLCISCFVSLQSRNGGPPRPSSSSSSSVVHMSLYCCLLFLPGRMQDRLREGVERADGPHLS